MVDIIVGCGLIKTTKILTAMGASYKNLRDFCEIICGKCSKINEMDDDSIPNQLSFRTIGLGLDILCTEFGQLATFRTQNVRIQTHL